MNSHTSDSATHPIRHKIFSCLLYALPIIFSLLTVFLITTSGEDNFQGAGNFRNGATINVIEDAKNAFNYNSRLTDVYAWSVIDFYDNQFQFGPDLIFRLIDVIMITAVFYLSTYLILNRKPKLQIKDALVFCVAFFVFIITPFGRAFYHEFSMIHNYVPLALITLLFSIPYLKLTTHSCSAKHPIALAILMLIAGLFFGMSATITPLAFLATIVIYLIIRRKHLTKPPLWFYSGILGAITGFLICWFVGSGVDHYTDPTTAATFDYLSLSEVFTNIPKLLFHEIHNFAYVFIPLIAIIIICFLFLKHRKTLFSKRHLGHLSPATINLIIIFSSFIIIHILGASLIVSPPRILIPAYLAGIIIILRLFVSHLNFNPLFITVITIVTTVTIITHGALLSKYHHEMSIILNNIKESPETTICINPSETMPPRIRVLDLSQANMIVNWGEPEPIYNKGIISCQ